MHKVTQLQTQVETMLRDGFPESAKDTRLNLDAVLRGNVSLDETQRWLVALSCAYALRSPALLSAVQSEFEIRAAGAGDAEPATGTPGIAAEALRDDAQAAASLMAMNNVLYRFRHLVGKAAYAQKPARLRMNRIAQPATTKAAFELACLAVSALNGCQVCIESHERTVLQHGLTEDHVHDAVRIAATLSAAAVAAFSAPAA